VAATRSATPVICCSGDAACLNQFFWVTVLPFAGCGAGAVIGLIGTIMHWRTPWILV